MDDDVTATDTPAWAPPTGTQPIAVDLTEADVPTTVPPGAAPTAIPSPPPAAFGNAPTPAPAVPQPMRRAPVNYQPNEAGWWLGSDGLWYPPETVPGGAPQQDVPPMISNPQQGSQNVVVHVAPPMGYQQPMQFVTGPPKSKVAAGLLQLFFGGFGIGRFYLGYGGIGAAQLLLTIFTFGLGGLWGFIDGIYILCGGVKVDSRGVPLT
jgi:hypothetical protein